MNTIKIRTTQNVEVEYPMASVGDRIVAHLIDIAVYLVWGTLMMIIHEGAELHSTVFFYLAIITPIVLYHLLCEIFLNGQSIGKKARDIKVIKLSGEAPSIGDYLLRWMFRLIDTTLSNGFVALIACAASQKGQRLGDMAAGTCVIRKKAVKREDRIQVSIDDNYKIRFPEVHALADKDIALIRKLLFKAQQHNNYNLLEKMAERVKETTGIKTDMAEWEFLQTVVKDYYHYTHGDVTVS